MDASLTATNMTGRSIYDQLLAAAGKGTPNYSLYAVPLMWLITMIPHILAVVLFSGGKHSNLRPREFRQSLSQKSNKSKSDKMYLQAEAAHQNGYENLGFFAAAVLAGNLVST